MDGGETDGDMEGGALSEEGAEEGASFLSIGLSGSAETCAASRCEAREDGRLPPQLPPRDVSFSFFVFSPGCTCPKGAWRYFPRDAGLMYSSWWPPISLWRGGGLLSAFHPPAARLCLPASRPCWRRHFAGREDQSCLAPIFRARGDGLGGCRHGRGRAGSAIEKPNFGYTAGETLNLTLLIQYCNVLYQVEKTQSCRSNDPKLDSRAVVSCLTPPSSLGMPVSRSPARMGVSSRTRLRLLECWSALLV